MDIDRSVRHFAEKLRTSVWFFNLSARRIEWANSSAIKLWGAKSLDELQQRSFEDLSEPSIQRLYDIQTRFEKGEDVPPDLRTFNPEGTPVSVFIQCLGVFDSGGSTLLCFEAQNSDISSLDAGELRALDAVRHTNVHICVIDKDFHFLMQNPKDKNTFGSLSFAERFIHKEDLEWFKNEIFEKKLFSERVSQITSDGVKVFGVEARLCDDPRSVSECLIVSQVDLTEQVRAEKEAAAQHKLAEVARLKGAQAEFKKDLELTKAVQDLILPKDQIYRSNSFSIYGKIQPASLCSGDWWWIKKDGDVLIACTADVTGHGAHSAMITALLASSVKLRFSQRGVIPLEKIFELINKDIYEICKGRYYSTFTCVSLNTKSGQGKAYFQGSPPIYYFNCDGSLEFLSGTSSLMGSPPDKFSSTIIPLSVKPGERLVIVSDGFQEEILPNGNMVGERRTKKIFEKLRQHPAPEFIDLSLEELENLTKKDTCDDDITLVVIDADENWTGD